ncbi:MAG: hypothetical protein OXC97_04095 [Candidatus Dadabacteria bacterium]|nr:hypothetical protein [Candidatus Dadabacteria bacterium]
MPEDTKPDQPIPNMSELEFDDVVRVLMGVAPEGEEITLLEEKEED